MIAFVAVDCDPRHGGTEEVYDEIGLPPTRVARTPNGAHRIFTCDAREELASSAGEVAPGIDIRCSGGYIVGAGSRVGGASYEWEEPRLPIAHLEDVSMLRGSRAAVSGGRREWGPRFVPQDRVAEGGRHGYLTRVAGWLRAQGHEPIELAGLLHEENQEVCVPPLPDDEVQGIATWGERLAS